MGFEAFDLPEGLILDPVSGTITGSLPVKGEHALRLRVTNALGAAERTLRIIVGDEIALTPPMGWNSWNIWGGKVSQEKVLAAARAMVGSGLRDHGWTYVNIDDGWQGLRGGELNAIQPNKKFPDMAALANEVHALGLKFGIYSTPWRTSFHGHIGSSADYEDGSNDWIRSGTHTDLFKYRFPKFESGLETFALLKPWAARLKEKEREKITRQLRTFGKFSFVKPDVAQWKAWGVDYLKYDWVPIDLAHTEEMGRELKASKRDIVYSVANNAPFSIAPELSRLTNSWRTSGDVKDDWRRLSKTGFSRQRWARFSGPGRYNDPDMLVVGEVGWGKPRRTKLSSDEQYTQMSLWCLLSAPLLLGCDLEKLDPFTLGLLTNPEVLEVNQDGLCRQATRVSRRGRIEVYSKPMEDGSRAVGIFNRGGAAAKGTVRWSDLGTPGSQTVRDLWRQKDLGIYAENFEAEVSPHGVVLVRVNAAK